MSEMKKDQIDELNESNSEDLEKVELDQEHHKTSIEEQLEKAKEVIEELENKNKEMFNEVLRAKAEMENIRKRSEKEVANARKFGIEKFARELMPIMDSLEQALKHEVKLEEAIAMKEGIELTSKMFLDALEKNGLEELDPKGEKFDPNLHEAMAMIPNPELENDTVFDVFQKGYLLNGRVVRAAKVVVVKN
ncbi:nucleotide exchange factor GrpE [Francisella frigiditurris]|uniref:Protein GrpE n=1 Tax=Francisella frigiditurris TaxID=1542390 RepID=A0A1J0KSH5_9GAMM|nr:nucleotide exchange factor GrpE [Francisella frigiditurris]APC96728.1 grpE family protein [Francisella frigiditurris]